MERATSLTCRTSRTLTLKEDYCCATASIDYSFTFPVYRLRFRAMTELGLDEQWSLSWLEALHIPDHKAAFSADRVPYIYNLHRVLSKYHLQVHEEHVRHPFFIECCLTSLSNSYRSVIRRHVVVIRNCQLAYYKEA